MKRGVMILAIMMVIAILNIIIFQSTGQIQQTDRKKHQRQIQIGFMRQNPLETSWAYVSFKLRINDAALLKARNIYLEAWKNQIEVTNKMQGTARDINSLQNLSLEIDRIENDVIEKMSDILTPEQMQRLRKWKEEQQMQKMRRPPSPPGM